MIFFKQLFSRRKRGNKFSKKVISRKTRIVKYAGLAMHPETAPGGFYVQNEVCITCGAPEVEGKGLIEHSTKDGHGSCYFKKQPETDEEVENAINAVMVSCIGALRYGGTDENILRKMFELGLSSMCDSKPIGDYYIVVRNIVTFFSAEDIDIIGKKIASHFFTANDKIINLSYSKTAFYFVLRNNYNYRDIHFNGRQLEGQYYKIWLTYADHAVDENVIFRAEALHVFLKDKLFAQNILWFEGEDDITAGASRPAYI